MEIRTLTFTPYKKHTSFDYGSIFFSLNPYQILDPFVPHNNHTRQQPTWKATRRRV
jgi:hypothetical protein